MLDYRAEDTAGEAGGIGALAAGDAEAVPGGDLAGRQVDLPPALLHAIAHQAGGRVVLVLGAGCSCENPTGLPLTDELARRCFRALVDDGVLAEDALADDDDLSAVAQAVVDATGHQDALVQCFPPERFRSAEANEGYEIAAALLRESAIVAVMTLNFDLAASTALANVGAGDVATIEGPDDYHRLSARNLIYLHRNLNGPADDLILRADALDEGWRGHWAEVVTQRVMATPFVVFAGLGAPAAVLVETARRITAAVGEAGGQLYVVDPADRERSPFFAALAAFGVADHHYFQIGWSDFMRILSRRVARAHAAMLSAACRELCRDEQLDDEDVDSLCDQIAAGGVVASGRLRAAWLLMPGSYQPHADGFLPNLADVALALATVERVQGVTAIAAEDGTVEFRQGDRLRSRILAAQGRGIFSRARIEGELRARRERLRLRDALPKAALVGGLRAPVAAVSLPASVAQSDEGAGHRAPSILAPYEEFEIILIDDLRANPGLAERLAA